MDKAQIDELLSKFNSLSDDEIIALFDPKEAQNLPVEVLSLMPNLDDHKLQVLGQAYPNTALNTAYLILKDKNFKGKPLYPRSTWANLADLKRAGLSWYALTFTSRWKGDDTSMESLLNVAPVQDLSKTDVQNAAGLKLQPLSTSTPQSAEPLNPAIPSQETQGQPKATEPGNDAQRGTDGLKTEENSLEGNEDFPDLKNEATKQAEGTISGEENIEAKAKDEASKVTDGNNSGDGTTVKAGRGRSKN